MLELAHPEADCAVAGVARDTGTAMVFSNQASKPMEGVSRILEDSPHWFQLYWSRSDALVESLVTRAARCGCERAQCTRKFLNVAVVVHVVSPEAWNTPTSCRPCDANAATVTVPTGFQVLPRSVE